MDLILASGSPRRKSLLNRLGLEFSVQLADVVEKEEGDPLAAAFHNAEAKAQAVSSHYPEALVIGADTIVVLAGKILGKPADATQAKAMLTALSGQSHQVITVVALAREGQAISKFSETTSVVFRELEEFEIDGYIKTGEPFDKAGAYGIQGLGGLLVQSIKGCYYNVVGLPIARLVEELRQQGVEVFQF